MSSAVPLSDQPHRLRFQTRDVDEYMGILSAYHAPVRAEPSNPSSFTFESDAILTGGICFSQATCATGVDLNFGSVFDGYGLTLPEGGSFGVRIVGQRFLELKQGMGLMIDSSSVTHAFLGAGARVPRISVTAQEMHGKLAELIDRPIIHRIRFSPDVRLDSSAARMATALSQLIYQGVEGDAPLLRYPAALASLRDAVLNLLLESIPHSYSSQMSRQAPLPTPGHVKRAIEFMSANASRPLRLEDIAAAAGTSARSLQSGFLRFRGLSPMAYLRSARLQGARSELLMGRPGASVSHIAYTWGFVHPSSFSTLYARAFGETPSATLRRAAK